MIRHLTTNIEGILKQDNETLGRLFVGDGAVLRKELIKLKKKGHLLIGSDNCKHFNPIDGCLCRYFGDDGNAIEVRHIGIIFTLCDKTQFNKSRLREDLGYKRYKTLGINERFKGESPYRICDECLKIIQNKEASDIDNTASVKNN
jgi:hypothetical protein